MSPISPVTLIYFLVSILQPGIIDKEPPALILPSVIQKASPEQLASMDLFLKNKALVGQIQDLAKGLMAHPQIRKTPRYLLRLHTLLRQEEEALATLNDWQKNSGHPFSLMHYELFLEARLSSTLGKQTFQDALPKVFGKRFSALTGKELVLASHFVGYSLSQGRSHLKGLIQREQAQQTFTATSAMNLLLYLQDYWVYRQLFPQARALVRAEESQRFLVNDKIMIATKDGATLSATLVRPKQFSSPQPTLLQFNIYTNPRRNRLKAVEMAAHGYVAVIADARGKRLSRDTIQPYETEVGDVHAVIDWISNQSWSDGRIGMFGGSYLGFAQWAATKKLHPGLKTIVPSAAAIPGLGLPMENNIFLNANYGWAFHVTNNRLMDPTIYQDQSRWDRLNSQYYQQGIAYRNIDTLDKKPNPWLQRWLKHPSYDAYWQAMVPFREDFAGIDIPILSFSGYYDDGQISAIHYFAEHHRYRNNARHYLVIGPYDHFTAQTKPEKTLRGYRLDPVAHINITDLTYEWLDHILRGKPKPAILKDKVNFQVMGANRWQHAPSLEALQRTKQRFYFSQEKTKELKGPHRYRLVKPPADGSRYGLQRIDLSDRNQQHNDYYPWPIIRKKLEIPNGLAFVSDPFPKDMVLAGRFSGELKLTINKKDVDVGLVLYEWRPDGSFFHLSYFLGRASFAKDMTNRQLLKPGTLERIPFSRTRMVGRLLSKGSRLVVLANANVNPFAQINYGTGKDVSDETIADAGEPLTIQWHDNSYVDIPIGPAKP